jgi:hypothetical protein
MPNDPGEQEISKTEWNPEYAADFESLATSLTNVPRSRIPQCSFLTTDSDNAAYRGPKTVRR